MRAPRRSSPGGRRALARALCIVGLAAATARSLDLPGLDLSAAAAQPPAIDGRLDDQCWRSATVIDAFHVIKEPGKTSAKHKAYVTRDDEWLYVAFDLAHPAADRKPPRFFKHDDYVQREDCVKVSFDPGTEGRLYFHFKLNRINVRQERRMSVAKGAEVHGWNIPWRSATRQTNEGWTAEIALPFCLLVTYGDLRKARLNLVATFFVPIRDRSAVEVGQKRTDISWGPCLRSFHEPDRFGQVAGLDGVELKAPFLPHIAKAEIGRYRPAAGQYCYDVSAELRSLSGRAGKVRLTVTDRPADGDASEVRQVFDMEADGARTVRVPVPVNALVKRTAVLQMTDPRTGGFWQRVILDQTAELDLFSVFLDRNYYTAEEHAVAVCRIGLPAEGLADLRLAAEGPDGRRLCENDALQPVTHFRIPLAEFAPGTHRVRIVLQQKTGAAVTAQAVSLVKRPPKPGHEWKIDRLNKVVLREGKPFFPVGLIMSGIRPESESHFRRVAEAGFDTVFHWYSSAQPEDVHAYQKVAAKHGLLVMMRPPAFARFGELPGLDEVLEGEALKAARKYARTSYASLCGVKGLLCGAPHIRGLPREKKNRIYATFFDAALPRLIQCIKNAKGYENLIGYNSFDEPQLSVFDQQIQGRALYRAANEIDGYRPTLLLYSSWIPPGQEATDWCDILVTDPYWIPGGFRNRGTPNYVSKITHLTRKRADSVLKVTWIVPMAEYWSAVHKRYILPREQFCQTYLALIHGAKGIVYFRYPVAHRMVWDALAQVARQLRLLGPAIVSPEIPQQISYGGGRCEPAKGVFPDVQVRMFARPEGGTVLLAANSQPYSVEATFTLSCLPPDGQVKRLFGAGACAVRQSAFTDRLEPFATRAYLTPDGGATAPVKIDVAAEPGPDKSKPLETEISRSGRPGKKNLVQNPGFELSTLPGLPDYYQVWDGEPLVGAPDSACGLDATDPYEGKVCFRVTRGLGFRLYLAPQHAEPTNYVFSLYLKGDRDGIPVELRNGTLQRKIVRLSTSWQRYWTTALVPSACDSHNSIYVIKKGEGTIWADAVQFEPGREPTEFEP